MTSWSFFCRALLSLIQHGVPDGSVLGRGFMHRGRTVAALCLFNGFRMSCSFILVRLKLKKHVGRATFSLCLKQTQSFLKHFIVGKPYFRHVIPKAMATIGSQVSPAPIPDFNLHWQKIHTLLKRRTHIRL